jgi:prepilin-type N-terminal cleavage/methylation domain-containing protein
MYKLNSGGFTLVEVMVAVAIMGILSTIALVGYDELVIRARMSQAKTSLAAIYDSEMGFKAEWDQYTSRLDVLPFQPVGTLYFNVGFDNDFAPPPLAPQGTPGCLKVCGAWMGASTYVSQCPPAFSVWTCTSSAANGLDAADNAKVTAITFKAGTHAHFSASPADTYSFTIDHNKQLVQLIPPN